MSVKIKKSNKINGTLFYKTLTLVLAVICVCVLCYADLTASRAKRNEDNRDKLILEKIKDEIRELSSDLFCAGSTPNVSAYQSFLQGALVCCGRICGAGELASSREFFSCYIDYSWYVKDEISKLPPSPDAPTREMCLRLRQEALYIAETLESDSGEGAGEYIYKITHDQS